MTSVLDENVMNLAVDGSFDDCQDFVKALFGDPDIKQTHKLAAVNSINWARILAQISYFAYSVGSLIRKSKINSSSKVRFVVPTGNFGDVLAGYFAKRMGFPTDKFIIAVNENDILQRFWATGYYEKKPIHGLQSNGGFAEDGVKAHEDGVKETYSPAMDILYVHFGEFPSPPVQPSESRIILYEQRKDVTYPDMRQRSRPYLERVKLILSTS